MQWILIVAVLSGTSPTGEPVYSYPGVSFHSSKSECLRRLESQVNNRRRTGWKCQPFHYEPVLD